jgi:hypothetical protein
VKDSQRVQRDQPSTTDDTWVQQIGPDGFPDLPDHLEPV